MPNWVRNNVTIRRHDNMPFNTSDVISRLKYDPATDLAITTLMPEPPYGTFEEEVCGKENFLSNGRYNWRIGNWGVKWDSVIIEQGHLSPNVEVDCIYTSFDTAWNSPVKILLQMSILLGDDYVIELQASDEFLGNRCDYNIIINNNDVEEIPIEGDYEEWWSNVWGLDRPDVEGIIYDL